MRHARRLCLWSQFVGWIIIHFPFVTRLSLPLFPIIFLHTHSLSLIVLPLIMMLVFLSSCFHEQPTISVIYDGA